MVDPVDEGYNEAKQAIVYAHFVLEVLDILLEDMQRNGGLPPNAKGRIRDVLRRGHDHRRTSKVFRELKLRLGEDSPLEKELKRKAPKEIPNE